MPSQSRSPMKLKNMPEKLHLADVITVLQLFEMSTIAALRTILLYSKHDNLPIYFNEHIHGSKVSGTFEECYDRDGEVTKILADDSLYIDKGKSCKTILNAAPYSDDLNCFIAVQQFTFENENYYAVDETGMWLESSPFSYNMFYCDGTELQAFLTALESPKIAIKAKKPSRLEQRESEFKNWLAAKAGITINVDADYQRCYKEILEPTQKKVWNDLKKMNRQLFTQGKDDFFKNQRIITFRTGTRNGRMHD